MVDGDVGARDGVIIDGNIHVAGVAGREDIVARDVITTTTGKYILHISILALIKSILGK